jgi:hypothetical protein
MVHFRRTLSVFVVGTFIVFVAFLVIFFARGYRFTFTNSKLNLENLSFHSQGILVANSAPQNAQIYINDKFNSLTSQNIYLFPGEYKVTIRKEGYSDWQKMFKIKGEVVSRVDAQLFSKNPSLAPLSNNGVVAPQLSPSKETIAYLTLPNPNQDPALEENSGLITANVNSNTFSIFRQNQVLVPTSKLPPGTVLEKTRILFSPNEKNLLVFFHNEEDVLLNVFLVNTNGNGQFLDVSLSYLNLLTNYRAEDRELKNKIANGFKSKIRQTLKEAAYIIDLSPDKSKILYLATESATLKRTIIPPLIGSTPTTEERSLQSGNLYIYDAKEDKNYALNIFNKADKLVLLQTLQGILEEEMVSEESYLKEAALFQKVLWFNDSRHLAVIDSETINLIEFDGTNKTLVYSGPFVDKFLALSKDDRLIILTNINPRKNALADLYTVSVK